jgi:hypothetical protein
VQNAPYVL